MMKSNALKKVYIDHLKRTVHPLVMIGGVFVVLLMVVIALFSRMVVLRERQYKTISSSGYDYVVESSIVNPIPNVYYRMENLVTCENANHQRIHVNAYMDLPNVTYDVSPLQTKGLQAFEVAVSQKVAEKLKVGIGDTIQLHIGIYEDSITYTIVDIFGYIDDYYNFEDDEDFSAIKLAYSSPIETGARGKYITFLSDNKLQEFIDENYAYFSINDVRAEREWLLGKIILLNASTFLVYAVVGIIYILFLKRLIDQEARKFFVNGYGYRKTKRIALLDYLIWIVTPFWISIFTFSVLSFLGLFSWMVLFEIMGLTSLLSAIILLRAGKNYE